MQICEKYITAQTNTQTFVLVINLFFLIFYLFKNYLLCFCTLNFVSLSSLYIG